MKPGIYASISAGLVLVAALTLPGAPQGPLTAPVKIEISKGKTAGEFYNNVQVLNAIPANELISAMQFVTYSLGVECSFCHMENAFEKDDKREKQIARKMMQMMFNINQVNFQGKREVTCYTCHRGSFRPLKTPIVSETALQPVRLDNEEEAPAAPGVPSPERIFALYAESLGGASAIGRLSSRVEKGAIQFGEKHISVEIFSKEPGKQATIVHLPDGDSITAYNETLGWTYSTNRRLVRDLSAAEVASARLETDLQSPVHFLQLFNDVRSVRPEKVGDQDAYVVFGLNAGKPAAKLYFDERSGSLLRMVRYVDTPLGFSPTQIDYGDYRAQGGVKIAFHRSIARPGSRYTIQIDEARDNVPVDDALFARPSGVSSAPN